MARRAKARRPLFNFIGYVVMSDGAWIPYRVRAHDSLDAKKRLMAIPGVSRLEDVRYVGE